MAPSHACALHVPPHAVHAVFVCSLKVHVLSSFQVPPPSSHDGVQMPWHEVHSDELSLSSQASLHVPPSASQRDWVAHASLLPEPQVITFAPLFVQPPLHEDVWGAPLVPPEHPIVLPQMPSAVVSRTARVVYHVPPHALHVALSEPSHHLGRFHVPALGEQAAQSV